MTAARKLQTIENLHVNQRNTDICRNMHGGDAVEMFTTSCTPTTSDARTGDLVEMFTTSCAPATSDARSGDLVEMFTTSCAPVTIRA